MLMVSGSKYGYKKSIMFIVGVVIGMNSQILFFSLGFGSLFTKYPVIQNYIKIPGIIYILFLAYKLGFSSNSKKNESDLNKPLTFIEGFIFQYLNPKAYLFTLTVTSIYSQGGENFISSIVFILTILSLIAPFSVSMWAGFGTAISKITLGKNSGRINKILGIITATSVVFII